MRRSTSHWWPSRPGLTAGSPWWRWIRPRERRWPRATCSTSGHRTVHHITGPLSSIESQQRAAGWRATLEAAGAPRPEPLIGDWSARAGYHLGRRLTRDRSLSAVFVANDQMALGLLRAMHEAGRRIPEEISVVGFDDIPESPYFTPPLTTVRQDFGEVGSRSLRVLVRTIESVEAGERPPTGSLVPPELVVRASTAVPPPTRLTRILCDR